MRKTTLGLLLLLIPVSPASARVKLAALPPRERVEIQLDHGRYTLVEEERIVPLLASTPEAGNNFIDFSWATAQVDKDSVLFRPVAVREGEIGSAGVQGTKDLTVASVAPRCATGLRLWRTGPRLGERASPRA